MTYVVYTDTEINIDDWAFLSNQSMYYFKKWWKENRESNPDNFSEYMNLSEWLEQYLYFLEYIYDKGSD